MTFLWTYIEKKDWSAGKKYRAAILIAEAVCALLGLALWLLIGREVLPTLDWMICFMGYPALGAWAAVIFYALRHSFHDGSHGGKDKNAGTPHRKSCPDCS